ncbi:unnamed protein product, partial [Acidithrix sp. C25]
VAPVLHFVTEINFVTEIIRKSVKHLKNDFDTIEGTLYVQSQLWPDVGTLDGRRYD